jgi:hypothetical protein
MTSISFRQLSTPATHSDSDITFESLADRLDRRHRLLSLSKLAESMGCTESAEDYQRMADALL